MAGDDDARLCDSRSCHHNKTRAAAREIRLGEYLVEDLTKPPNCLLK